MDNGNNIDKPIIVRKGSKTQNRINLPVTSNFNIGDEVAVISYDDYLASVEAGTSNVTEELEKSVNIIKDLELKVAELEKANNELLTINSSLESKISGLNEELTEEVKAGKNSSVKVARLEEKVIGLSELINSNEKAFTNGINSIISTSEAIMLKSEEKIIDKTNEIINSKSGEDLERVNEIIGNAGFFKRVKGFRISPSELVPAKVTSKDLDLPSITSGAVKELENSKPVYKLK